MLQLDSLIRDKYTGWLRVRCGWHLVNRGMAKAGIRVAGHNAPPEDVRKVLREISEWMYSWMAANRRGRCETQEEFEVLKTLFLSYLQSTQVREILGEQGAANALLSDKKSSLMKANLLYTKECKLEDSTRTQTLLMREPTIG